jgi:hypothetical protein
VETTETFALILKFRRSFFEQMGNAAVEILFLNMHSTRYCW